VRAVRSRLTYVSSVLPAAVTVALTSKLPSGCHLAMYLLRYNAPCVASRGFSSGFSSTYPNPFDGPSVRSASTYVRAHSRSGAVCIPSTM
jgi:hypothetical protein